MTDENPDPRVSNRMPPLAWIILAAVVILVVIALWRMNGHTHNASGQMNAPVQQPSSLTAPVMPQQSQVPNTPPPSSDANGGEARQAHGSSNEPGGNQTTGGTRGAGGTNTTGAAGGPT